MQIHQVRATLFFEGWQYSAGDFMLRVTKATLRPQEEFKGFVVDVEYLPVSRGDLAAPCLNVSA
jgi:hypothetical protein